MNTENHVTAIQAEAPLAEILRYSTELRSMTQGRGSYTMHFSRYDEVPSHLTQKIIDEGNEGHATSAAS
jgi:elongation factor G